MGKRIELACGLASVLLGVAAVAALAFGPTGHEATRSPGGDTTSRAVAASWSSGQIAFLAAFALLVVGVALGAYLDARHDANAGLVLLTLATVFLLPLVVLTIFGLGLPLLPAALLALVAAVAGGLRRDAPPTPRNRPAHR